MVFCLDAHGQQAAKTPSKQTPILQDMLGTEEVADILKDPARTLLVHVRDPQKPTAPLDAATRVQIEILADQGNAVAKNVAYVDYIRRQTLALSTLISKGDQAGIQKMSNDMATDGARYVAFFAEAIKEGDERARANLVFETVRTGGSLIDDFQSLLGTAERWTDTHAVCQIAHALLSDAQTNQYYSKIESPIPWAVKAAMSGEVEALIIAAQAFKFDNQYGKSLEYADRAAESKEPKAIREAGHCRFLVGMEEKSKEKVQGAIVSLRSAADMGDIIAKRLLAVIYLDKDESLMQHPITKNERFLRRDL